MLIGVRARAVVRVGKYAILDFGFVNVTRDLIRTRV